MNYIKVNYDKILTALASIAVVVSAILIPIQIKNYSSQEKKVAFDLCFRVEDRLTSDKEYRKLRNLMLYETSEKLEKVTTIDNLDNFLGEYESLALFNEKELLDEKSICDWFGADLYAMGKNEELMNYLNGTEYFEGVKRLIRDLRSNGCFN